MSRFIHNRVGRIYIKKKNKIFHDIELVKIVYKASGFCFISAKSRFFGMS